MQATIVEVHCGAGWGPISERGSSMRDLPSALTDGEAFNEQVPGRHLALFLDYDGTLASIVDRPEGRGHLREHAGGGAHAGQALHRPGCERS
jgi:hypothetical protein